jgi:hypothetical protein
MKKSKSSIEWNKVTPLSKYLAMVFFIALPFVGFVLGMKYEKQLNFSVNLTEQKSNSTKEKNSTFVEKISTEKYLNKKYGFEFSYPSNWRIDDKSTYEIILTLPTTNNQADDQAQIVIDPTNYRKVTIPIEKWIEISRQKPMANPAQVNSTIIRSDRLIDGIEPVTVSNEWYFRDGKAYYFIHNKKIYYISYSIYEDNNKVSTEKIVDKIISSFKFSN